MSRFARAAGLCLSAIAVALATAADVGVAASATPRVRAPLDTLRDFDAVSLAGSDTLVVDEGANWSVEVDGDPRAIEKLDIYVEDHILHVTRKREENGNWTSDKGARVHVVMPRLARVNLAGSGDITVSRMSGEKLAASVAGSGDLVITDMDGHVANLNVAGSGTLTARGRVAEANVSIAGSGDILADSLVTQRTQLSIAGSGDAYVHASEAARVSIVGSGDATVSGTTNCTLSKIGSGDLRCKG